MWNGSERRDATLLDRRVEGTSSTRQYLKVRQHKQLNKEGVSLPTLNAPPYCPQFSHTVSRWQQQPAPTTSGLSPWPGHSPVFPQPLPATHRPARCAAALPALLIAGAAGHETCPSLGWLRQGQGRAGRRARCFSCQARHSKGVRRLLCHSKRFATPACCSLVTAPTHQRSAPARWPAAFGTAPAPAPAPAAPAPAARALPSPCPRCAAPSPAGAMGLGGGVAWRQSMWC